MTTFDEFVEREILPTLGEYAGDFDVSGIADEVSEFDERRGYVWRPEYEHDIEAYSEVMRKYDVSAK